jgi:putative endonuclease
LLECSDGSLYCGITNNIEKRILAHQAGTGSKYTRSRLPVKLVSKQQCGSRSQASKYENYIKRLTREQKKSIVETDLCTI